MREWMEAFTERMRRAFGKRVAFVGLQGSRARGEETPQSDIDVVVVLDRLDADDISAYRAALEGLAEREKICGFLSGRSELAAWEKGDLFQFVHDTVPFYGDLSVITPPLGREHARKAALSGACNIYHSCVHNLLFGRDADALYGLYKTAGFVLRAKYFWQTGVYVSKTAELAARLPEEEARLLTERSDIEALVSDGAAFEKFSQMLFGWAGKTIRTMSDANQNNT